MLNGNGQKNIYYYKITSQKKAVGLKILEKEPLRHLVKEGNYIKEGNFIMMKGSLIQCLNYVCPKYEAKFDRTKRSLRKTHNHSKRFQHFSVNN